MKNLRLFLFACFLTCFVGVSQAQVTVAPFLNSKVQFLNQSGTGPAAGYKLCTYAAGTTSPLGTYSDLGITLNSNPIILDSQGRATIYLTSASYKFVLLTPGTDNTCSTGATVYTQDNVTWATPLSTFSGLTSAGNFDITQPTAATSLANQSSFTNCLHGTYWTGSASADDKWCFQDVLGTGTNPTTTMTGTHSGSSGTAALNWNFPLTVASETVTGALTATGGPNVLNCKNVAGERCIDPSNTAGWSGSDPGAWVNSAMSDCPTNGCTITIAAGIYSATTTVSITKGSITLQGAGAGQSNVNFGATRWNTAAALTGFDITGPFVQINNMHIVSSSSSLGTDDCIRVRGPYASISFVTTETCGRDGIRIDSSGSLNANLGSLFHTKTLSVHGDGLHFTTGGVNNNAWTIQYPYNANSGGWGINLEDGKANIFVGGDTELNTTGGWQVKDNANLFLWSYCETTATSSFIIANGATHNKIFQPSFGQCNTITDNNAGIRANEIHYQDPTSFEDVVNYVNIGPKPAATTPTVYSFMSGSFNNGWLSIHDSTNNQDLFAYDPSGKRITLPSPVKLGPHALDGLLFQEQTTIAGAGAGVDSCYADSTLHGRVCSDNNTSYTALGSKAILTADWTCGTSGTVSSCAAATIVGSTTVPMTFNLPLVAGNYQLDCDFIVAQATSDTANQWNLLTATNGATNVTAYYAFPVNGATAPTLASNTYTTDQGSTTSTFQIGGNWTLGALVGTAKYPVHIHADIQGASASGTVLSVQLLAPTAGDLVTIYRGSGCVLH